MKYLSEDGKVFDTEQKCVEHENLLKEKAEEQRIRREQLEEERKKLLDNINNKYASLQKDIYDFEKRFGAKQKINFISFSELAEMLYI